MHNSNSTYNLKRLVLLIVITVLITLINISGYSQDKIFTLQNEAGQRIEINYTFIGDTLINPFKSVKAISGLAISCDLHLNSDTSLVRIILVDEQYNEFLICESYPLLSTSMNFSLIDYAEETVSLDNIHPFKIKFEIIDASVYLKELTTSMEQIKMKIALGNALEQQRLEKIKKLNENIERKKDLWVAGETSISKMTYEEKKQLFGGSIPNLQGFEYYAGGIFEFSDSKITNSGHTHSENNKNSNIVSAFDWRNRHSANKLGSPYYNNNPGSDGWITPVKNQGSCGSCWIFGPMGAIEAKVNLYFNQHIDIDLSEQHVMSCNWGGAGCLGASSNTTLMFAQDSGIVNETCFPYVQDRTDCSNKCSNPTERIKISNFSNLEGFTYEQIRKELINEGPIAGNANNWVGGLGHSMCLVGFGTIEVGDTINANGGSPIIIRPNDINIGRTYLIFKNSWGTFWGEKGYVNVMEEFMDRSSLYTIDIPILSLKYTTSTISCNDFDADGYFYWGLGPKPSHCPVCPDEPDGDDSNPCIGPMDEYGHLDFFTSRPIPRDTTVLAGDPVPDLYAEGENIAWYGNEKKTFLLHNGNVYTTGMINPGVYTYFVTQTNSGCESDIVPVKLTILPINDLPPIAEDVTIFLSDPVPELIADGINIRWYSDPNNPLYDVRDGQIYNTTVIGDQLWMADNLNLYTPSGSWYYDNDSLSYAETYGRLYTWMTALNSCPINWHLPSDKEWMELEVFLGMNWIQTYEMGFRGRGIGYKLFETGTLHWEGPNPGATNEVNFNALPAGTYSPEHVSYQFEWLGTKADFLTATDTAYTEVIPIPQYFHRTLVNNDGYIGRLLESCFSNAYSVRCVSYPSKPISEQNSYLPTYKLPGKYTYYVTQTISEFESPPDTVIFTILSEVRPPKVEDTSVCEGQLVPDLTATGEDIRWYGDFELKNLLHVGNTFAIGQKDPGFFTYYVTQTFSNSESLPDTITLTINPLPAAPLTEDLAVCEGDTNQTLQAIGENIVWYSDVGLTNAMDSGNVITPSQTIPGTYDYFVTQTISGCESQASTARFTIVARPDGPATNDVTICEGEPIADLTAEGEAIKWYSDSSLKNLVGSGNSFATGKTCPGTYTYFVSLTVSECEGIAQSVDLIIYPLPMIDLGKDSTIYPDQSIMLGPFGNDDSYFWNDGSQNPYFLISGSNLGTGSYQISVIVIDSNGCINTDSAKINVLPYTSTNSLNKSQQINIFPNPAKESINISVTNSLYETILIKIFNQKGEEINVFMINPDNRDDMLKLDISHLPSGMYYIQILTNKGQYCGKIIML